MTLRTLAVAALLFCFPAAARAVTVADLVALSKAGVSADILVALIDADRTVFTLTRDEIVTLTQAGVPDRVVVKMLGSSREFVEEAPPPLIVGSTPPRVSDRPRARIAVFVPLPLFVAVPVLPVPRLPPLTFEFERGFGRFMNDGWIEGRGFGRFMNAP